MKYDGPSPGPDQEIEKTTLDLRWGSNGCLLTLMDLLFITANEISSEIDDYNTSSRQAIIIWENPDNCTKPRVRSIMYLEEFADKAFFDCMRCKRSSIILGGYSILRGPTDNAVVSIVSLSTGQAEATIRKRFISIIF